MITFGPDFPRLSPETLQAFAGTPSGFLADALGRSGALDHRIKPVWDGPAFVGTALPVWTTARDNLAPYAALKAIRPGDVVLVATGEFHRASVLGDVMIGMMRNAGAVAVVTDGLVRDVAGIRETGLPAYAWGVSPNSPYKNGPGGVAVPISIGGVLVSPGDLVLGDSEGVVIAPRAAWDKALTELGAVRVKEREMDAAVRGGAREPDWLERTLNEKGIAHAK